MGAVLCLALTSARANQLVVTNVAVSPGDETTAEITFDLAWEHSWRYTSVNHDAAWLFFKFQRENQAEWRHVTLSGSGSNPAGYSDGSGTALDLIVASDHKGLFARRAAEGSGALAATNVTVVWDFDADGLTPTAKVLVRAFALEMVFVPQGAFWAGNTNGVISYSFRSQASATVPFYIDTEDAFTIYYSTGPSSAALPAALPKGYDAFYCMKYEITQGQYRDFLNTLTRPQQEARTATRTANYFAMSDEASIDDRNGIRCPASVPDSGPIVFGCDFSGGTPDGTFDQADDGEDLACNYLFWGDGCAFAAWAALRPMTELEYEKACRGPIAPVENELAWGDTTISHSTAVSPGDGTGTNRATGGNCNYADCTVNGPYRVGIYATAASDRQASGSSYWGIMDLAGNVMELCVSVQHASGRAFTGLHGDGSLVNTGDPDYTSLSWPAAIINSSANGAGWRGGSWIYASSYARVADRLYANYANGCRSRNGYCGFRSVRSAPAGVTP